MTIESYEKMMSYLAVIEAELNNVAKAVGHCSFDEFINNPEDSRLQKAA